MGAKNNIIVECDQLFEFIDDASVQSEMPPHSAPALSDEEKEFAQAITRLQCARRRALLTWREIFEVVQALGYRKVEQSAAPPTPFQSLGNFQGSVPVEGAGAETPS
jgi:hypothetical protein